MGGSEQVLFESYLNLGEQTLNALTVENILHEDISVRHRRKDLLLKGRNDRASDSFDDLPKTCWLGVNMFFPHSWFFKATVMYGRHSSPPLKHTGLSVPF